MLFKAIKNEETEKKIWLKEEGDSINGVFRGEVYDFKAHFLKGQGKKTCPQNDSCSYCAQGSRANFQFRVNFIHKGADGTFQTALYESDWYTYQRLSKVNEQFPLENNIIKIYKGSENGYKVDLFERVKEISKDVQSLVDAVHLIPVHVKVQETKASNPLDDEF